MNMLILHFSLIETDAMLQEIRIHYYVFSASNSSSDSCNHEAIVIVEYMNTQQKVLSCFKSNNQYFRISLSSPKN